MGESGVSLAARARPAEWLDAAGPVLWPAASFLLPLVIFVRSASSQPASWDTAELQGVPYILGIAHPTGFPLYTLLGYLFSHLFAFGTVAYRLNVFSGVCASTAALCGYLLITEVGARRPVAFIGSTWFAVTAIVWTHASRAEAHTLALALSTLCILCIVRWFRHSRLRDLRFAAAAFGLALATHPVAIWLTPGILVALLLSPQKPAARALLGCCAIAGACLLLYAYLPLRSWFVVAHGLDPTASFPGANGIFWNYNNPHTMHGLAAEVSGSQFGAGSSVLSALSPLTLQSYLWAWIGNVNSAYGLFGLILAVAGAGVAWRRDWRLTTVIAIMCFAAVPFSIAYASVEGDPDRYRMLSLWGVPVFMCAASLAANGTKAFLRQIVVAALMLLWGVETFQNNSALFANRNSTGGRTLISEAASRIPEGSVVVTPWLDATSLAYGAYIDGTFKGRRVVGAWPPELQRYYRDWLRKAPVYVIAAPDLRIPAVDMITAGVLDGSHTVYRIVATRDPAPPTVPKKN